MNLKNFFIELKRRNVYKVAIAYAIVGWLVIQIATTVVPALHLSDAITSAVALLVILGFPIALILAWAFELTPEGIKRTEDVDLSKSIARRTGRNRQRSRPREVSQPVTRRGDSRLCWRPPKQTQSGRKGCVMSSA